MNGRPVLFREVQKMRQWWILLVVICIAAFAWWSFIEQIIRGRDFGDNPGPDWVVITVWLTFGIGAPLFFAAARLIVEVTDEAVRLRWIPLWRWTIPLASIRSAEVRAYRPLWDYGGWGIRYSTRHGWAYNVSGSQGVQLVLQDGKRLLIGSRQAETLAETIRAAVGRQ